MTLPERSRDVVLPKDIMNLEEASTFLMMDPPKVRQLAEERRIPSLEHNGQWAFSRKSLEKWIRSRPHDTT
jgi:hypothetical protein